MKKIAIALLVLVLTLCVATACTPKPSAPPATPEPSVTVVEVAEPDPTAPAETEPAATAEPEVPVQTAPAVEAVEAVDATPYNTKENAVPFGQWVSVLGKNYASNEYEPYDIRITKIIRDAAEVQAVIDAYTGVMNLTLTEDQARDIEFAVVEYEFYFPLAYTAPSYGITLPSTSLSATAKNTTGFKTEGGMSYIGVGSKYDVKSDSNEKIMSGEIVTKKAVFTVLKNYDESEYLFHMTWYNGEIVAENARELYFSVE